MAKSKLTRSVMEKLKYQNCAECGAMRLGYSFQQFYDELTAEDQLLLPPPIRGYINERPWCGSCLDIHFKPRPPVNNKQVPDENAAQQTNLRRLEDQND